MKTIHCDICGKEIKSNNSMPYNWDKDVFIDMNDNPIEDVCEECFNIIYCCINMMKGTGWRPDFHEVLESDSAWTREKAGYKLCDLKDKTGLEF